MSISEREIARRKAFSKRMKELWQDPEYRVRMAECHRTPEVRKKTSESVKALYIKDPAKRKKRSEDAKKQHTAESRKAQSELMKRQHAGANPNYSKARERMYARLREDPEYYRKTSERMRRLWKSEKFRSNWVEKMRVHQEDEEYRRKLSISVAKHHSDPEYRRRASERTKAQWEANPELRELNSRLMKARWQDPEWVNKIMPHVLNGSMKSSRGHSGYHESKKSPNIVRYKSLLELAALKYLDLDQNVIMYEYEALHISYKVGSITRYYIPDFLVWYTDGSYKVVEVKPESTLLTDGNFVKYEAADAVFGKRYEIWSDELLST